MSKADTEHTGPRHTLLLRLAGPMQSWGVQSRFTVRDTLTEPTKSGVIGLVCAALGRDRAEPIDDLAALRMGVRVDREGQKRRDYHTSGRSGFLRARGAVERKDVVPSERFYLADAHFTVGLEGGDAALLKAVHQALRNPRWLLALGRKAFPPGWPVFIEEGWHPNTPLMDALERHPWRSGLTGEEEAPEEKLRYVLPADYSFSEEVVARHTRPDQPLSFQPRRFALREVCVLRCSFTNG